jgi:hypothetical protein
MPVTGFVNEWMRQMLFSSNRFGESKAMVPAARYVTGVPP